jgi:hypothetical protein
MMIERCNRSVITIHFNRPCLNTTALTIPHYTGFRDAHFPVVQLLLRKAPPSAILCQSSASVRSCAA